MARKKEEHFGGKEFIELHRSTMENLGFWDEMYRSVLITALEMTVNREILRDMHIADILVREDKDKKVLIKWEKRYRPLTDKELEEQYGK